MACRVTVITEPGAVALGTFRKICPDAVWFKSNDSLQGGGKSKEDQNMRWVDLI